MSNPRLRFWTLLVGCSWLIARPARADVASDCITASEAGQFQRDSGALLSAREQLLLCARDICPAVLRRDCLGWLSDVEARIPTVVVGATDAAGKDLVDVTVVMDGKPFASRLGARAAPVDPGEHVFRFQGRDGAVAETRIVAREGERRRPVIVVLEQRGRPPEGAGPGAVEGGTQPSASSPRIPLASWVLGGVAVAGLAGFGYFFASGLSDRDELEGRCAPRCQDADVDPARRKIVIADVSLGIAAVAALGAVLLYLAHRPAAR